MQACRRCCKADFANSKGQKDARQPQTQTEMARLAVQSAINKPNRTGVCMLQYDLRLDAMACFDAGGGGEVGVVRMSHRTTFACHLVPDIYSFEGFQCCFAK